MPRVSVVMPVFNGEDYIGESIDSVLKQSMADLELIVVNDGSTDNTLQILEKYANMDVRVKVLNRANSGRPSYPKNDGIALASGDYVCFLDHDDLYDADRTRQLMDGLDRHPEWVAAFHDTRFIDSDGSYLPAVYLKDHNFLQRAKIYLYELSNDWFECNEVFYIYQSLVSGAIHTSTVMIAMSRIPAGEVNFDTRYTICDDTDLWIRLGLQGKMGYLNRVLSSYRQHQASITRNREKFLVDAVLLQKNNFMRVEKLLTPEQSGKLRFRIACSLGDIAYLKYRQYRHRDAREAYREALSWLYVWRLVIGYIKTFIPETIHRGLKEHRL